MKDGFSERGGYPVEQKKMMQWSMRITAYAERLLQGLDTIDWPEPLKEMQRNWIGKSVGASVKFPINKNADHSPLTTHDYIEVFTTRVDTIFGVTFLVLAPEHELVPALTTPEQKAVVDAYIAQSKKKSELDRMSDTKTVSGAFTGGYVINPVNHELVPIFIADYVLAGYGTGAVMAVPSGDQRDYLFAKHFNLPIVPIIDIQNIETEADPTKEGTYINSDFMNGLNYKDGTAKVIEFLEGKGAGKAKVNFRMRDAIFGRQRYWGEPVPVYFKGDLPHLIDEKDLPLILPEVDKYLPTETGEPPLARATNWKHANGAYEHSTMPGWAGSSWYWYRYMDAQNDKEFASQKAIEYWKDVDLYIGGSEHATGHLLYSRFWNKFLKDMNLVVEEEPFKKLINQGMIQGVSEKIHITGSTYTSSKGQTSKSITASNIIPIEGLGHMGDLTYRVLISDDVKRELDKDPKGGVLRTLLSSAEWNLAELDSNSEWNIDITLVNDKHELDIPKFLEWRTEYQNDIFLCSGGFWWKGEFHPFEAHPGSDKFFTKPEVEKMSKSKWNVINPDQIIARYGADTLRMYEMFLGPLEQSKPWNTNGIEGVFKFLRKFWKLFHDEQFNFRVSEDAPTKAELKSLHKIIRKVEEDVDRFSFNTSVSSFMIAVNELTDLKCNKRAILQELVVVLSSYAPHICEELWVLLGNEAGTLSYAAYPKFNPEYLVEDEFAYPISINGKMKMNLNISLSLDPPAIENVVVGNADVQKYLDGKSPKKVIVVKGRIVNIVV